MGFREGAYRRKPVSGSFEENRSIAKLLRNKREKR
jgi:hypothetical protein